MVEGGGENERGEGSSMVNEFVNLLLVVDVDPLMLGRILSHSWTWEKSLSKRRLFIEWESKVVKNVVPY